MGGLDPADLHFARLALTPHHRLAPPTPVMNVRVNYECEDCTRTFHKRIELKHHLMFEHTGLKRLVFLQDEIED